MHLLSLRPGQAVLCCMCVQSLISANICCLVGGSVFEGSQRFRLSEIAGLLMGLPTSSASSSLSLVQAQRSQDSVHWLGINMCI